MKREVETRLDAWLANPRRQPLILRGARQVGKTWLVRDLAARAGRQLVEVNFERDPALKKLFSTNDPRRILGELSLALSVDINPDRSLLFLDEIQAAGDVLARLRWFYEELPQLPVAAAGSLLEFSLADHSFSMPVGRIAFQHIEPMGFPEYLRAHGQERLLSAIRAWRPSRDFSSTAHEQATRWFHRFAMVGGMPAVVAADIAGREPRQVREQQKELVAAYRADFAKYAGRMDRDILNAVLNTVVASLGRKFVYAHVGEGVKQHQAKRALDLLTLARLVHQVRHTAANGLPLGAEVKASFRKAVTADVAVVHALLGTPAAQAFPSWESLPPSLRGQITDQLAAQHLRLTDPGAGDGPELYYWQREGGRPGEIDYLIQLHGRIIPIELKAGAAGAMKSLHQFMFERRLDLAVRADANPPSVMDLDLKTTQGHAVRYRLVSVPLYMLWNLPDIL
ncbi:MAG: ATP-binding protein [Elusimicrobia bacterium]|nr:ATP-binding protein [Elusimicrobiota bacterium]